ncbi:MAG: NTP transferase domain-containing protein [Methanophagales archaeon]|nr:NTP transferase domain-containing protein [Methanophagales archaeon]
MKAVILAAGKGERLSQRKKQSKQSKPRPKPLTSLLGLSLIERAILTAQESGIGISDFVIVVGHRSEEVVKYIADKKKNNINININIDFVVNEEWEKGNGLSVLTAKRVLKEKENSEDFVLLMCDHVFDPDILKGLLEFAKNSNSGKCVLCIDSPENIFDLDDATKILLEENTNRNRPKIIGKEIENYNAVDCGIFYCTAEIFDALEEATGKGKYGLSDAVQCLIDRDRLDVFEIGGRFWCDIDTPSSLEYAEKKMLGSLEKTTDGIISKNINRRISKRITAKIVNTDLRPTQITIISFIMALIAAAFFSLGEYKYLIIGGILAQLSSIIDGCDGEVARLKFLATDSGAFVDSILDRYADGMMILGLIFGYWMLHEGEGIYVSIWIIGLFALIGSFMLSYTNALAMPSSTTPARKRFIGIPVRRDMRVFMIMLGAFLNQVPGLLLLLAILTNLEVIRRVFSVYKL